MRDWKECQNCEGEGSVVIWGRSAHEVPASRARNYPTDFPNGSCFNVKPPYECPLCHGHGGWYWGDRGQRIFTEDNEGGAL
jgi:hypothetical protein